MSTLSTLRGRRKSSSAQSPATPADNPGQPSRQPAAAPVPSNPTPPPDVRDTRWYIPTPHVLAAERSGKLPAPAPCQCGCPIFWLDPRLTAHCAECRPPASQSMQRGDLHVIIVDDAPAWLHNHPELTVSESDRQADSQDAVEFTATPPDVAEQALSELRPTLAQIDSGECCDDSPPCPHCGKGYEEKNFLGQKKYFCCVDKRKPFAVRGVIRQPSAATLQVTSRVLRLRAELNPATSIWRRKRADRLAREAAEASARDAAELAKINAGQIAE